MSIKRKDVEFNLTFLEAMELVFSEEWLIQGERFRNGCYLKCNICGTLDLCAHGSKTTSNYNLAEGQLYMKFRAFQVAHQAVVED